MTAQIILLNQPHGVRSIVSSFEIAMLTCAPEYLNFRRCDSFLSTTPFVQQGFQQLWINAKVRVPQTFERLLEISKAAAGAVGKDSLRSDHAQVPPFGFQTSVPFIH